MMTVYGPPRGREAVARGVRCTTMVPPPRPTALPSRNDPRLLDCSDTRHVLLHRLITDIPAPVSAGRIRALPSPCPRAPLWAACARGACRVDSLSPDRARLNDRTFGRFLRDHGRPRSCPRRCSWSRAAGVAGRLYDAERCAAAAVAPARSCLGERVWCARCLAAARLPRAIPPPHAARLSRPA